MSCRNGSRFSGDSICTIPGRRPIGFQYAAEVSAPAPESTSQGLLLLVGQVSGIIMVTGMSMNNKSFLPGFLKSFVVLSIIIVFLVKFIKESALIKASRDKKD